MTMEPFEFDDFFQGIFIGSATDCSFVQGALESFDSFFAVSQPTLLPVENFVNQNASMRQLCIFGRFAGDYWIIGLDEQNYSRALVGRLSFGFCRDNRR